MSDEDYVGSLARDESKEDLPVAARITRAIEAESTLGAGDRGVKVAVDGDRITLSGTVTSDDARQRIEGIARDQNRSMAIDNEIQVIGK